MDKLTVEVLDSTAEAYALCGDLLRIGLAIERLAPQGVPLSTESAPAAELLALQREYDVVLTRLARHSHVDMALGFLASVLVTSVDDDVDPAEVVAEVREMAAVTIMEFQYTVDQDPTP